MKKIFVIICIVFFLFDCSNAKKFNSEQNDNREKLICIEQDTLKSNILQPVNQEFKDYLSCFDVIDLPITIYPCEFSLYDSLYRFKENEYQNYNEGHSSAFAQILTNNDYIAVIIFADADCYVPILTTYNYAGKIIDSKDISIGDTDDIGYRSKTLTKINKDFTILITDSVSTYEVDSLGNEILGTRKHYILYQKGELTKTGKIKLSQEQKK
jgi:hypothetical protein